MKTCVVPAQITTVEDKIAGSLNFAQILLLVFSLIIGTAFYGLIPPKLHLNSIKLVLMVFQFFIFGALAIRYHGRIFADWLIIILRFKARPRVYIYTKNDVTSRQYTKNIFETEQKQPVGKTAIKKTLKKSQYKDILPDCSGTLVAVKPSKKGGLDVEYQKI